MGAFTHILRDLEQIFFPNRDQHPVPSMDGPFTPNSRLDTLEVIGDPLPGADDVAEGADGALYVSAGRQVWRLDGAGYARREVVATFDGDAGALAIHPDGGLLVGVASQGVVKIDRDGHRHWLREAAGTPVACVTAIAASPDGSILLCEGSARHAPDAWLRDLMEKNRAGRLLRCGPSLEQPAVLRQGLAWPDGLMTDGTTCWLAEAWTHRVTAFAADGRRSSAPRVILPNLPGYPARLAPASGGGFWLAMFAARTHLTEFVLREDDFRNEMMRTMEPHLWVGPALATTGDCYEPMQWGGLKALGIEKPWSPPRSYGLLARFDADGTPAESLHSRVGGRHHGITSVREAAQGLIVVSRGAGRILIDRTRARA
ncbi:hypothetical protein [Acidisphaera rubrifaciens]|uniref:Strictosidine synthase n=1 Tax=Acidisphaera rubrifaciens HS-AP3 TaxID=1231350 RepID=A0A0D6P5Z9_9PROT|nr:hypothetical protein [Acidisphaera rubrifaciens]GAN76766.1 hypothetical protein Asru_0161_02 [Acidisphaera rubrifaciens HS-AP3]